MYVFMINNINKFIMIIKYNNNGQDAIGKMWLYYHIIHGTKYVFVVNLGISAAGITTAI